MDEVLQGEPQAAKAKAKALYPSPFPVLTGQVSSLPSY